MSSDWCEKLRSAYRGRVLDSLSERAARARDFGGMHEELPCLVVQPAQIEDVQATVRVAREHGITLTVRGAGHSQSGQGLGAGLVIDMALLDRVLNIDTENLIVEVEAGATWRAVVDATFRHGLMPVGLTRALDTTVAGTLSVGGIGAESFIYGPQVDNVCHLDVVTSAGELVRCSAQRERALFDAVRAGLGQCGVIVRVAYPLRRSGDWIDTRAFLYRDMDNLLLDTCSLAHRAARGRFLVVRLASDPLRSQSMMALVLVGHDRAQRNGAGGDDLPPMHAELEASSQISQAWTPDGSPGHSFFRIFAAGNGLGGAAPGTKNPWVDVLLPLHAARASLAALASNSDRVLTHGPAELVLVRRGVNPAPLFVTPEADLSAGLGMYSSFPPGRAAEAATIMQAYARDMARLGGKRYLAGYFGPTTVQDWSAHYGATTWSWFCAAKAKHDPTGLFGSSLIPWP